MDTYYEELLMSNAKYCTLTVSTNPASATCTLTYGGNSYSSKTATVKKGTIISYSVYHSTYGTTTGSIVMDANKILTCTGTSNTSYTEYGWTRPTLSSNGSMGGSSNACYSPDTMVNNNFAPYEAFNGTWSTSNDGFTVTKSQKSATLYYYTPTAIRPAEFKIEGYGNYGFSSVAVSGSNDNSSYTSLTSYSGSIVNLWNQKILQSSTSNYYKYFKFYFTTTSSTYSVGISEIEFSGYYQTSSTTYSWTETIT